MSMLLGLGLGLSHSKSGGVAPEPSLGALEIDGFPVLVDSFQIIFS